MIRKRLLSACLALALCLSLLPATALADAPSGQVLYVGGEQISTTGYWTTDSEGKVTSAGATQPSDNYIHYDAGNNTLTLHNASIKTALEYGNNPPNSLISGAAIGVLNQNGDANLTITLEGTNTIAEVGNGICVLAHNESTGNASLTIMGNGSLTASVSVNSGILVQSNGGNATLSIENAEVTTTSSSSYGVLVRAKDSSNASLTVNGGSLTATGKSEHGAGIQYTFGGSSSGSGKPSLTVSNSAIVKASGGDGGISDNSSFDIQIGEGQNSSGGIVFDGNKGTVYGDVTLKEDLTIGEGESLTIPDGASLNTDGKLTVDGGTLTQNGTVTGDIIYKVTGVSLDKNNLTLDVGGTAILAATVEPDEASNENVTWSSDNESVATVNNGVVTAIKAGTATITVKTEDGEFTDNCTVTVNAAANVPVESVSLDKTSLGLTEGDTETLTATVEPSDATNKNVTWSTSDASIATVTDGVVTAVAPGTATITVTTENGNKTATCTVTVREDVPDRPVSIPDTHEIELIAGDGGEAKTSLTNAGAGTKITVTATPDEGYELAYITVDGERISGVSFTMPAHDVTVRVYFSGGALPFADVTEGAWYYDAASYVAANGLMDGVSASEFAPDANMTRAMLVTILWRLEGEPVVNYLMPFADVDGGAWYAEAVRWAASEGIVEGVSATEFAPDAEITREQLAAILHRFAGEPATAANLATFTDAASVSAYAVDAMAWCVEQGIITGVTDDTLAPQSTATRAQCAAMLMRFAER